jgi:membrane protease YdiL (CAAX protease family)
MQQPGRLPTAAFLSVVSPGERRLWRPAFIVAGGLLLGFLFVALGVAAFDATLGSAPTHPTAALPRQALPVLQTSLVIAGLALGVLLVAALTHRRPVMSFITTAPRFRWPLFAAGLLLFSLVHGVAVAASALFAAPSGPLLGADPPSEKAVFAAAVLLFYLPTALGEEVLFRGWLTQQVGAYTRNILIVAFVSSVIFAFAHLGFEPLALAGRFVSGAAYAWAALRLGGLEFAIGAHLAKNTTLAWFVGLSGSMGAFDDRSVLLVNLIAAAILIAAVEMLARRPDAALRSSLS